MATTSAYTGRTAVVRLSDVPKDLRLEAASRAAKKWGLRGIPYLELMMVAETASPDCKLTVDEAKAHRVLVEKKFPPGAIPALEDMR